MSEPALRPGRPGGKRDANRKRRRSQIAEAALGLFVEAGVELTSIDQIVAAAGVAKGSFYRYYADKEALVEALFEPIGAAVVGAAVVGTAAVMAHHDAHYHHRNCGCHREWHDGHWNYYYGSNWEYRDPDTGVWYSYRD